MTATVTTTNPQNDVVVQKYTVPSTAVAVTFKLGFVPRLVKIYNPTKKTTIEWAQNMDDASGFITQSIADNGTSAKVSSDVITSNGITPYAGDKDNAPGFTLGVDTYVNIAADVIIVTAQR